MTINKTLLTLTPPSSFDFMRTASSHGWVELAPNTWDKNLGTLRRVHRLGSGKVVNLSISGTGSLESPQIVITVSHTHELSAVEQNEITRAVGHMFRLDEDLTEFYALCMERGGRWLKPTAGLGRILRSPTVFEDVAKTILTTNIQWGGTRRMVRELVEGYGEPYPGDDTLRAFPTPAAVASASPETFAEKVHAGYRSPFIHILAQRAASGELDLEALNDKNIPTPELKKRLLAIKGVGNYAAATLLMLLGRYDELAVDTAFRQFVTHSYFDGQHPSDDELRAVYADWGKWKYLAYWFDI